MSISSPSELRQGSLCGSPMCELNLMILPAWESEAITHMPGLLIMCVGDVSSAWCLELCPGRLRDELWGPVRMEALCSGLAGPAVDESATHVDEPRRELRTEGGHQGDHR